MVRRHIKQSAWHIECRIVLDRVRQLPVTETEQYWFKFMSETFRHYIIHTYRFVGPQIVIQQSDMKLDGKTQRTIKTNEHNTMQ
jgi:hypothetical protein